MGWDWDTHQKISCVSRHAGWQESGTWCNQVLPYPTETSFSYLLEQVEACRERTDFSWDWSVCDTREHCTVTVTPLILRIVVVSRSHVSFYWRICIILFVVTGDWGLVSSLNVSKHFLPQIPTFIHQNNNNSCRQLWVRKNIIKLAPSEPPGDYSLTLGIFVFKKINK